jgi:hypothetical protein
MTTNLTGGCQCGAVRYRVSGPLKRASICHCRMCQKAFGSFFAPLVGTKLSGFALTRGALGLFKSSDLVERGFCRDCGTPLTFRDLDGDWIEVSIGSLDDPAAIPPVVQVGVESRLPWFSDLARLPSEETGANEDAKRYEHIAKTSHQHPDHDTATWSPEQRT